MTSEQIQESRKEAEDAGWVKLSLNSKGPEQWGWCGYKIMEHQPGQWWGYLEDHRGHSGLGINVKTRQEAQEFCEKHYHDKMGNEAMLEGAK